MRRPLLSLLLAATLLAAPVLAAAHDDADHHGLQPGAAHCVVCMYAHGAGHGALPAAPRVIVAAAGEMPQAAFAAAHVAVTVRLHPIRGPPVLLA